MRPQAASCRASRVNPKGCAKVRLCAPRGCSSLWKGLPALKPCFGVAHRHEGPAVATPTAFYKIQPPESPDHPPRWQLDVGGVEAVPVAKRHQTRFLADPSVARIQLQALPEAPKTPSPSEGGFTMSEALGDSARKVQEALPQVQQALLAGGGMVVSSTLRALPYVVKGVAFTAVTGVQVASGLVSFIASAASAAASAATSGDVRGRARCTCGRKGCFRERGGRLELLRREKDSATPWHCKWQHSSVLPLQSGGYSSSSCTSYSRSTAAQCCGTVLAGRRCRRNTKNTSGYCWQHLYQQ